MLICARKKTNLFVIIIVILMSYCPNCIAQSNELDTLVKYLQKALEFNDSQPTYPIIYERDDFNVLVADSTLSFRKKEIVLKSPTKNESFPLSFSVIYRDNIVSLFEPGVFVCHKLSDYTRNEELENFLNTKKFEYHLTINNNLCGLSKGQYWIFDNSNKWKKSKQKIPFKKRPKLYEDSEYIVYSDCMGEWGGTVYFYNKANDSTYFTEATCACSIIKTDGGYEVLSQLGHMFGISEIQLIADPQKLSNLKDYKTNPNDRYALGHADTSKHSISLFHSYWGQIFSSFIYNGRTIYAVDWLSRTFLAEIKSKDIIIVAPLFNSNIHIDAPITTNYPNGITLVNLDSYRVVRDREVSMIIIKGNEITKIDWNKKHDR